MPTTAPLPVLALGPWPSLERLARCFGNVPVAITHLAASAMAWSAGYCEQAPQYELILLDGRARNLVIPPMPADGALVAWVRAGAGDPPAGIDHVLDEATMAGALPILARLCVHRAHARRMARERTALSDANPDAVVVVDGNGDVRFVNAAALALFGRSRGELLAQPLGFTVADGIVTEIEVRHGPRARRVEMRVATVDWEGHPASLATLRDVTEQRLMDERLRQSQKLEAIGRLAAGIAHDFNNLLQGVIGNLEILAEHVPAGSLAGECGVTALHAALQGVELTARLLSLSRRQVPWARPVDLRPLLREVRAMMVRIATGRPRIEIEVDPAVQMVVVDPVQLETALLNVLGNAADAKPVDATIRIDVRCRTGSPRAGGEARDYVVLSVSDNGVGMDEETRRHAFDPFFTTKGAGGTGLGLPIVKEFAESAGGGVVLHSAPGQGTRVELWLPARLPQDTLSH